MEHSEPLAFGRVAMISSLLAEGLQELQLSPPASTRFITDMERLAGLLARWAQRINLTSCRTPELVVRRLILGSLALTSVLPEFSKLIDIGSGAGFPGLPLAAWYRDRPVTLLEARERRHYFQLAALRLLQLTNVNPLCGRAERLSPTLHFVAVAQAVGAAEKLLRWMLPWVEPGGVLAIPCAWPPPEISVIPGLKKQDPRVYQVPLGGPKRCLWLAQRLF